MTVPLLGKSWLVVDGPLTLSRSVCLYLSLSSSLSLSLYFDGKDGRINVLLIVCAYKMQSAKYCILDQEIQPP